MYRTVTYPCDLSQPLARCDLGAVTFEGDDRALRVLVEVTDGGNAASLAGAVIGAWMQREDGTTLRFPGAVTEGGCEAVLPAEACAVTGRFSLLIRATDGEGSRTLFWGEGTVTPSATDAPMTAGTPLPDLETLLARIAAMEQATLLAQTAAAQAEAASQMWETAASEIRRETACLLAGKSDTVEEGSRPWLWEQGGLSTSTGNPLPDTSASHLKRARTAIHLPLDEIESVRSGEGLCWAAYLYGNGFAFLGCWPASGSTEGAGLKSEWLAAYPGAEWVRFVTRQTSNEALAPAAAAERFSLLCLKQPLPGADWEEVPLGPLRQGRRQADTRDYPDGTADPYYRYRVTQESVTALAQGDGTEMWFVLPRWTLVYWREGESGSSLPVNTGFMRGGAPVRVRAGSCYFRAGFARMGGSDGNCRQFPITPEDAAGARLFVRRMPSASESDPDALRLLAGVRRQGGGLNAPLRTVVAHASDAHGDHVRLKRFADFADLAGADLTALTGDVCCRDSAQGFGFCHEVIQAHMKPAALCVGNHDSHGADQTDESVYEALMAPVAALLGNETGKTWYLRDLGARSLRVISLNLFQCGAQTRGQAHLSSEQLQWYAGALASTPEGWGVLVLRHSALGAALAAEEGSETFFGTQRWTDRHAGEIGGDPIAEITDAFIGRERIDRSWTQGGAEAELRVSADFTACGGEFIAHLAGHLHCDAVCPLPGTRFRQLLLGVTCLTPVRGGADYPYLSNCDDMGRESGSPSQDAFNLYVIDREEKTVTVLRAGQRFDRAGRERRMMTAAYA